MESRRGPYRRKKDIVESDEENNLEEKTVIGNRIKKRMLELKMTQDELSEKLDLSRGQISNIINGHKYPPAYCLTKLSDTLHLSLDYIFGLNNSPSINEEVKAAERLTGLSRKSICNIKAIQKIKVLRQIGNEFYEYEDVNKFLESPELGKLIHSFENLYEQVERIKREIKISEMEIEQYPGDVACDIDTIHLRLAIYEYGIAANRLMESAFNTEILMEKIENINKYVSEHSLPIDEETMAQGAALYNHENDEGYMESLNKQAEDMVKWEEKLREKETSEKLQRK